MNVIGNSCVGAYIYKNHLKSNYENPFTWAIVDFNSMFYLIKNYNKIDFNKFKLIKDAKCNFSIVVDGHVKIDYVHYKLDRTAKKPIKKKFDVFYCKIWEFIVLKYLERIKRMQKCKDKPIFILANWFNVPATKLTYDQMKLLDSLKMDNIICASDKIYPEFKYIKQIPREANKKLYNKGLAKNIYEKFIKDKK